jgi:hypothetical protein
MRAALEISIAIGIVLSSHKHEEASELNSRKREMIQNEMKSEYVRKIDYVRDNDISSKEIT